MIKYFKKMVKYLKNGFKVMKNTCSFSLKGCGLSTKGSEIIIRQKMAMHSRVWHQNPGVIQKSSAISDSDDITETPFACHRVSLHEQLLTAGNAQTRYFLCTGSLKWRP